MGSGVSSLSSCFRPVHRTNHHHPDHNDVVFAASEPLDETLGHSFCYVRSSARFLSPTQSDRFISPSNSLRFSPSHEPGARTRPGLHETGFKAISGASVSANSSTPRTVLQLDNIYDDATDSVLGGFGGGVRGSIVNGFETRATWRRARPLGPNGAGGFFLSGPIERGALSGPLDPNPNSHGPDGQVHFSAPLGGLYVKKKRKKGISGIRKALYRNFSEKKQRPWVVPVLNFVGRKEGPPPPGDEAEPKSETNVQWALGKAGEDRVHVVVSEEQGWLFVGIYDGFNGPDAPEFLMGNLYRAFYNELQGLFWEVDEDDQAPGAEEANNTNPPNVATGSEVVVDVKIDGNDSNSNPLAEADRTKRVTFQSEGRRRRLWELLAEAEAEDGLDLSGSERFAFSVDDALTVSNEGSGSAVSRRWLLLSKLKQGLSKHKEGQGHGRKLFPWRFGLEDKEEVEVENTVEERSAPTGKRRKEGPVDHELVLSALSRALQVTENAYLEMTDKVLDTNPELALMGSCLLVVLMRDEDVYVMNLGDSRAIVAHYEPEEGGSSMESRRHKDNGLSAEDITESSSAVANEAPTQAMKLTALQLSTDHSTSIEEEVIRIKNEHPDDKHCIVNDRVKGRLKVTRAFGAGFLKQPKWNDTLLEMFRNEYIGTTPYISLVSHVENFMEKFPDGDPAQHLIEELLFRAAKKAGMDFHELLDIPQGDRRKYHDDVTVMVISLEGRIWKSSGKYL
ncbi:protein phosphatase 2C 29 [Prunus yedoensis var. nudiflora]|uniref:Protein phosphatase 2C 29 n=1 Tax=Prunus yedoensis var. nudiflora TaxID=2094558 RepID=A0A314XTZ1_PRUYE|nr:protein phosphatase 2C 29 [Prunus yedoensis var. nudiflora]